MESSSLITLVCFSLHSIYYSYTSSICTNEIKGQGFTGGSLVKNPSASTGLVGSIPGLGRSPGEGNGYPLQHP